METFERSAFTNREKQVDIALSARMMEDSFKYMKATSGDIAVLAAGDGDFVPTIRSLQSRELGVRVVSWSHAAGRQLREAADEFIELDPHFDMLTRSTTA